MRDWDFHFAGVGDRDGFSLHRQCGDSFFHLYIYIYIYIKENARTTTFTATCSYQVMSYGVKMVDPQALSLPGLVHIDIRSS